MDNEEKEKRVKLKRKRRRTYVERLVCVFHFPTQSSGGRTAAPGSTRRVGLECGHWSRRQGEAEGLAS